MIQKPFVVHVKHKADSEPITCTGIGELILAAPFESISGDHNGITLIIGDQNSEVYVKEPDVLLLSFHQENSILSVLIYPHLLSESFDAQSG